MFVNGKNVLLFNAVVTDDFEVGPASFSSNFVLGGGSTTPKGYGMKAQARPITLPVAFVCQTTSEAVERSSLFLQELSQSTVELYDDDSDTYYSAVLTEISSEDRTIPGVVIVTYKLNGIEHGKLVKLKQTGSFVPLGASMNGQDCRLSVTVNSLESDGSYKVGNITFYSSKVSVGQLIVIDGFAKIVYVNGTPSIGLCDLITFPKVYPGRENFFECKDELTIEYYPVYK